jgi:hypothetical protein
MRESLRSSREEREEVKSKSQKSPPPHTHTHMGSHCSPFYKTRGVGYTIVMVQAREREKESECTWSKRGAREELFTHAAGPVVTVCYCCCMWSPKLVSPLPT